MKILAVGDIHTKVWIIECVKKLLPDYDMVVFVGDYADDFGKTWLSTIKTWEALMALQSDHPEKVHLVLGNHDYLYLHKTPTLQTGYNPGTQSILDLDGYRDLKHWLSRLPIIKQFDGVSYSHAGISEDWDGKFTVESLWNDTSPIWQRPKHANYRPITQVIGHTPHKTITEIRPNIWCIDTFSTYPDGSPIGDRSMLEIVDGKFFRKVPYDTSNYITQ